jgi:hypothetical protein
MKMAKLRRRLFSKSRIGLPGAPAAVSVASGVAAVDATSRRAFLQGTAGAAAGAAAIIAAPKVASIALDAGAPTAPEPKAVVTKPSGPAPHEPVAAYVRNAERGEVTVMSGKRETTYTDPALVKRLTDAAH